MTAEEPEWKLAWQRSLALQRALRERGHSAHHVNAQAEYDYCAAVSKTPRDETPPTAKEWFRAEDVPVPRADAVDAAEPTPDLHAVRTADAPAADRAGAAPLTRWQVIAKDRGGSYWQQVQPHLWAIAFFAVGVIIGAFSAKSHCP